MRTKKSAANIQATTVLYFITFTIPIVTRTYFINVLGISILGVNTLFVNIITLLSLSELGIGTAVGYRLYAAIANSNKHEIAKWMNFYKKAYRIIAAIVLIIGLAITPFIHLLAKVKLSHMEFYFLLYAANSAVSYLLSYKQTLLSVNQQAYIRQYVHSIYIICLNLFQIVVLYFFASFALYIVCQIVFILAENIVLALFVNKKHAYILGDDHGSLVPKEKVDFRKDVFSLMSNRIGLQILAASDSIIISKFVGINFLGLYSNYYLILTAITGFILQITQSISASVGNLNVTESKERNMSVFFAIQFSVFWISSLAILLIAVLMNPFIEIWIGRKYLLPNSVLALMLVNSYIMVNRNVVVLFKDAKGLFYRDRYRTLITAAVNLPLSIALSKVFGLTGVIFGTTLSMLTITVWYEPVILFKYGFFEKSSPYFHRLTRYSLFIIFSGFICFGLFSIMNMHASIITLIIKASIVIIVNIGLVLLFFRNSDEFAYLKYSVKLALSK
jgi:O-antigen/teichoic acid export membrane protein